jgi:anti-sigma regulatory factor (Ser/Thr protein kinase)
MGNAFTSYLIEDRSYVSYIKREIHTGAARAKFSEIKIAEIDIVVSEMTSNLVKHAGRGELLYRIEKSNTDTTIELISIDNGPGMEDTAKMIKDGESTTATLGQGLGAIHRLSDTAQVYSRPGWGTIVYSLIHDRKRKDEITQSSMKGPAKISITALCVPKARETDCGDGYRTRKTQSGLMVLFADGLGHGPLAKLAVDTAADFFMTCTETDPVDIIRKLHENIRKTRGLVGTVGVFDTNINELRFCGVGNIHSRFYTGIESRNFMSYNGTIGLNIPNSIHTSRVVLEKNQHLILCSDGIQTRWDLGRYPGIFKFSTMVLAASIYKDFTRRNDDASVLIAKIS